MFCSIVSGRNFTAIFSLRQFAGQVDIPGCRATAGFRTRRAFDHFNLFHVKDIAGDRTQIADTIDIGRGLSRKAAHLEGITGTGIAIFTQLQGNSRGVS